MPLYLAIDAGGTKTRCLLADEERVLAHAETGTIKLMRVAEAEAALRLRAMLAEAAEAAGISLDKVQRTCFGLAGSRSESVQHWARQEMRECVGGELILCGDEAIALDAAFKGGPGILAIAGTGSHVVGRTGDGTLFSAGGWGPVLGDEGSGYWIGLETLRAALRALDEGDQGDGAEMLREIQREWGLGSLGDLVALGNLRATCETEMPPDFAGLAPVVARCAEAGNEVARDILRRAGEELADAVLVVNGKMSAAGSIENAGPVTIAFAGSILERIASVHTAFAARISNVLPEAEFRQASADSLDGALWRARGGE